MTSTIAARRLYQRLREARFPSMGKDVGDFALYDSIIASYGSRLAEGETLDEPEASRITADDETLKVVEGLRAKTVRTEEEQAFLDYFALLEEIRLMIVEERRR